MTVIVDDELEEFDTANQFGLEPDALDPDESGGEFASFPIPHGETREDPTSLDIDLSTYLKQQKPPEPQPQPSHESDDDDEKYFSPLQYDIPSEEESPEEIRKYGTAEQRTQAISAVPDIAAQMNMFAASGDIRNMYNLASQSMPKDGGESAVIAQETGSSPELVNMLQKHAPSRLEAMRVESYIMKTAGPDSYIARRFAKDMNWAAANREYWRELANLQKAMVERHGNIFGIVEYDAKKILGGVASSVAGQLRTISTTTVETQLAQLTRQSEAAERWLAGERGLTAKDLLQFDPMADPLASPYTMTKMDPFAGMSEEQVRSIVRDNKATISQLEQYRDNWKEIEENTRAYYDKEQLKLNSVPYDYFVGPAEGVVSSLIEVGGLGKFAGAKIGFNYFSQAYNQMMDDGVDHDTALALSAGVALPGAILAGNWNMRNVGKMLSKYAGYDPLKKYMAEYVRSIAAGIGSNVGQSLAQTAAQAGGKTIKDGGTFRDFLTNLWGYNQQWKEEGWGGGAFAILAGGKNLFRGMTDSFRYRSHQKAGNRIAPEAQALAEKMPDKKAAEGEIRNVVYDGIASGKSNLSPTTFADAGDVERFMQGMPSEQADAWLESAGTSRAAFEQAAEHNIDVEIPTEKWLLLDDDARALFRPTPSMATASYMQAQARETQDLSALAEKIKLTFDEEMEKGTLPPLIVNAYKDEMAAGKTSREAKADIALVWAWIQTQATRRGKTAAEFADERIIRIVTDSFFKNNPTWLQGMQASRLRPGAAATTEEANVQSDVTADTREGNFDPALAEGPTPLSERSGQPEPAPESAGTGTGQPAAGAVVTGSGGDGGSVGGVQAPKPARNLFGPEASTQSLVGGRPADKLTGLPINLETTTTAGVMAAPNLFQFKRQTNQETGVKKGQELPGDIDPAALGTMVFYEDVDGKRFVVSGHHRLELLRRHGRDEEVRAVILRESDGWSTDAARVYGAALNIREGGGDVDDYAAFFREAKIEKERANAEGLLRRENAKAGYAIGALGSDNVFYGFLNDELSAKRAAAMANAAPGDHELQDMMLVRKIKTEDLATFAGYVNKMRNSGKLNLSGVQKSLFSGTDYEAMLRAMEKESREAAKEAETLDKKAASMEALLKAGKILSAAEMNRHGVRAGNRAGMEERAAELRREAERWRNFFHNPDILAQVQERAGTAAKPETFAQKSEGNPFCSAEDLTQLEGKTPELTRVTLTVGGSRLGEMRKNAREILKSIQGNSFTNRETGWEIIVSRDGVEETTSGRRTPLELAAVIALPELMKKAAYARMSNYKKRGVALQERGIAGYHRFFAPLLVNGAPHVVQLLVKEGIEGNKNHYLHRIAIVDPAGIFIEGGSSPTTTLASVENNLQPLPLLDTGSTHVDITHWLRNAKNRVTSSIDDVKPDVTLEQSEAPDAETKGVVDLYRADAEHRQAAVIRLLRNADRSTVPHEFAHIFLDDMREWVMSGEADMQARRDYAKLLAWSGDLSQRNNIEKVARGFEQYLAEGVAPSMELVDAFSHFGDWITRIYSNVRQYVGLDMNDKVRGVYDRWLASEQQIAEAQAFYSGNRGNAFLNLIDDEDKRRKLEEKRRQNLARAKARFAGDMTRAWLDAHDNDKEVLTQTEAEINAMPVYLAIEAARNRPLDRAGAENIIGVQAVKDILAKHGNLFGNEKQATDEDVAKALSRAGYWEKGSLALFLRELSDAESVEEAIREQGSQGRKKRYYEAAEAIRKAGGMDMDTAIQAVDETIVNTILERHDPRMFHHGHAGIEKMAKDMGFPSGDAMLSAMAKAPGGADFLEDAFNEKMNAQAAEARKWATDEVERLGDPGVHNPSDDIDADNIDITRQAIHQAMSAQEKAKNQYKEHRRIVEQARRDIRAKTIREAKAYHKWAQAEHWWAGKAAEAAARGDRVAALKALDKQQYLHAMVTEAFRVRQAEQRFIHRWSYRTAKSDLSTVKYEFREAMKDILHSFGIVKSRSFIPDQIGKRLAIPQETDGYVVGEGKDARNVDEDLDIFEPPLHTLIPEWIKAKRLPEGYQNIKDLTVIQMEQMDETLGLLLSRGRGELTALKSQGLLDALGSDDVVTQNQLKTLIMDSLKKLPERKQTDPRTWRSRKKRRAEHYIVSNLQMDRIAAEVDGNPLLHGKEMGHFQNLIRLIRSAGVVQKEMLENFANETRGDFARVDELARTLWEQLGGKFFEVDGAPMPDLIVEKKGIRTYDAEMLSSIYLNMGNTGNRFALENGLGLTQDKINILAKLATEEQWKSIERIGQKLSAFYPILDAVYFRQTNRHMPKVEGTPFSVRTADDKIFTSSGWYYPLAYDPDLSDRAAQQAEMADYRASMYAIHTPQKPVDGFIQGRAVDEDGNPVVARSPLLRTSVLINHLTNMTRWATHAEPLFEFRRLTMDPEFKAAFIKKLGAEKYRYLREWTNRMARPDKGRTDDVIASMRSLSTIAALGLNIKSALRQLESTGIAADTMTQAERKTGDGVAQFAKSTAYGWYWMARGYLKMGLGGFTKTAINLVPGMTLIPGVATPSSAAREMFSLSAEARMRANDINKEIRDMTRRTDPTKRDFTIPLLGVTLSRDMLYHFTWAMDQLVAGASWWGAYHQAAEGHTGIDVTYDADGNLDAKSMEKVIAYADSVLRTQQSPYDADYTAFQADNGARSLFTQFLGGVTPYMSHSYGMLTEAQKGGFGSKAEFVRSMMNVHVIPNFAKVVLLGYLKNAIFGGDDEEENKMAKELFWASLSSITSPLPYIRDAQSVFQSGLQQSALPASLSVPGGMIVGGSRAVDKLKDGDVEEAALDFGKAMLRSFAMTRQAVQVGQAVGIIEEDFYKKD